MGFIVTWIAVTFGICLVAAKWQMSRSAENKDVAIKSMKGESGGPEPHPVMRFNCTAKTASETGGHVSSFKGTGLTECLVFNDRIFLAGSKRLVTIRMRDIEKSTVVTPDAPFIMNLNAAGIIANEIARRDANRHRSIQIVAKGVFGSYELVQIDEIQASFNPWALIDFIERQRSHAE